MSKESPTAPVKARYIVADVFDGLRSLADNSVDLACFSSPYFAQRRYVPDDDREIGIGSMDFFVEQIVSAFGELARVLKPGGAVWYNVDDKFTGCVDEETEALTSRGWLRYDELTVGDTILTLNPGSYLAEWGNVESVNVYPSQQRKMLLCEGRGHVDAEGRPHHVDGRAIVYRDGAGLFAVHGTVVPPSIPQLSKDWASFATPSVVTAAKTLMACRTNREIAGRIAVPCLTPCPRVPPAVPRATL